MVGLEEVTWPLVVLAKMALPHQSIHLDGTNPFRTASPKHRLGQTIGGGGIPSPSGRGPHAETDFLMHAFLRSRCSFEPVHIAHQHLSSQLKQPQRQTRWEASSLRSSLYASILQSWARRYIRSVQRRLGHLHTDNAFYPKHLWRSFLSARVN